MAKHLPFTGLILLATLNSGHAIADCTPPPGSSWVRVQNLIRTLTNGGAPLGMTACSMPGQEPTAQEEHHYAGPPSTGGELWDYKCGNSSSLDSVSPTCPKPAVDPRRQLGTWSVQNNRTDGATVTYDYTAFGNAPGRPLKVFRYGTTRRYDFCDAGSSVGIFTLVPTRGRSRVCR